MADDGVVLSRKDRNTLADLIRWWRREGKTKPTIGTRPQPNEEDDVGKYIARTVTPITGLAPHTSGTGTGTVVDDDVPGHGTCEIYKLFQISDVPGDVVMYHAGFSRTVYNLSEDEVDEDEWVHVQQDAFGIWWLISTSEATAANDWLIDYISNVCVDFDSRISLVQHTVRHVLTGELVETYCEENPSDCCPIEMVCCNKTYTLPRKICGLVTSATGTYASLVGRHIQFTYFQPASPFSRPCWASDATTPGLGLIFLCGAFADGVEWLLCGCQGVISNPGNPCNGVENPTHAGRADLGCPDPDDVLPATFTVPFGTAGNQITGMIIDEGTCPEESGTGTSSGTTGGGVTLIPTDCCMSGTKSDLHVTLTGAGDCPCVLGSYPITWDGTAWRYSADIPSCGTGYHMSIQLACSSGSWVLTVTVGKPLANSSSWVYTKAATCALPMDFGSASPAPSTFCSSTLNAVVTE